jgi:signal transduction histidine kinase
MRRWRKRPGYVAVAAGLVAWATALAGILVVHRVVGQAALQDMRAYLGHTAAATAALIDPDSFARITRPEQDETEEYRAAAKPLRVLLETNPEIRFAYTGITTGTRMHFVLDGSPADVRPTGSLPDHARPMDEDNASPGEIEVNATRRVTVEREPTASAWGMGIRAQAPVFARSGAMVGYAGITMSAARYYNGLRRTQTAAAAGAVAAAALSFAFGMVVWRIERARRRAELVQARLEGQLTRERDRVRRYAQALDRADEEVRRRVAADLHDGISQTIAGQNMLLETARLKVSDPETLVLLDQALSASRESLAAIRTMIQNLSPPELAGATIEEILSWLAELFSSRYGFRVTWRVDGAGDLAVDQRLLMYRIVRELLFNACRHSHADSASVALTLGSDTAQIVVADEGIGFKPSAGKYAGPGGFGLLQIDERVRAAAGTFFIDSEPGGGCRVHVTIPASTPVALPAPSAWKSI